MVRIWLLPNSPMYRANASSRLSPAPLTGAISPAPELRGSRRQKPRACR